MKNSGSSRSPRQTSQNRSSVGRGSRSYNDNDHDSYSSNDNSRYSSDDGGYYSNRNIPRRGDRDDMTYGSQGGRSNGQRERDEEISRRSGSHEWGNDEFSDDREAMDYGRRDQYQRNAPYRSSEQGYQSNSRWDRDQYGQSDWNRPGGSRGSRGGQPDTEWGGQDTEWGGQINGRDQEMADNSGRREKNEVGDRENNNGGRYSRYADVDDVEGQYDEDYRDRDSYSRSRDGIQSGFRPSSGHRR